jgi:hypothetical protein
MAVAGTKAAEVKTSRNTTGTAAAWSRLGVADPQAEGRETPGERVSERDHQAECGEQAARAVRAAESGGEADAGHDRDDQQVARQVGDGPAAEHGNPGHRQGPEADQDAGAHVTRQPDRGADRAEGDRLREDAGHQEVHVVRAGHVDRAAERVADSSTKITGWTVANISACGVRSWVRKLRQATSAVSDSALPTAVAAAATRLAASWRDANAMAHR